MNAEFCALKMIVQKKWLTPSIFTENASMHTNNCVAALSMVASIVFGS